MQLNLDECIMRNGRNGNWVSCETNGIGQSDMETKYRIPPECEASVLIR
jgi:hypothetical protein